MENLTYLLLWIVSGWIFLSIAPILDKHTRVIKLKDVAFILFFGTLAGPLWDMTVYRKPRD